MENPVEPAADRIWEDVSRRLRDTLNEPTYATWFSSARAESLDSQALVLAVPNDFTRGWIETHFSSLLRGAVRDVVGGDLRVDLRVSDPEADNDGPAAAPAPAEEPGEAQPGANPKYTFDNFVIGSSNRFAHAAALAVAEAPAQAYNPLFIYGGTGLGKTHLLQAISAYVSSHSKGLTTRYVTSERLLRSQTSAMIPAALKMIAPAAYDDALLACPGLAYRRDAIDRLHVGEPQQLDLWRIARKPLARLDLEEMIVAVAHALLPGAKLRLDPAQHPYTLDGIEDEMETVGHLGYFAGGRCG